MVHFGQKKKIFYPRYITLKWERYRGRAIHVRFVTVLAVLLSLQFSLGILLCVSGIALAAVGGPQQLNSVIITPLTTESIPSLSTETTTPQPTSLTTVIMHPTVLGIDMVSSASPIWAGVLMTMAACVGLYTVYVPGTRDSLICYIVFSILATMAVGACLLISIVALYSLVHDTVDSFIVTGARELLLSVSFNAVSCIISVILLASSLISSGLACGNICHCGQRYIVLDEEYERRQCGKTMPCTGNEGGPNTVQGNFIVIEDENNRYIPSVSNQSLGSTNNGYSDETEVRQINGPRDTNMKSGTNGEVSTDIRINVDGIQAM